MCEKENVCVRVDEYARVSVGGGVNVGVYMWYACMRLGSGTFISSSRALCKRCSNYRRKKLKLSERMILIDKNRLKEKRKQGKNVYQWPHYT